MDSAQEVSAQQLSYLSAAFMCISFWEYIIWLPNEVYAWRKVAGKVRDSNGHLQKITMGECLAIYIRYTLVGCAISVAPLDFGRPVSCQAANTMTWVFGTLSWAGVSLLFTLRLYIMWQRSRVILAIFGFLWISSVAIWIAVVASWRARNAPEAVPAGAAWCLQSNTASWRTANWGAEMGFDLCVLVATLLRLRQLSQESGADNGSSKRMRAFILRSNLGYFIVSFVLSCAAFITQEVVQDVVLSQVMTPPTIALAPIVAIRIVFSATNDATIEDSRPGSWNETPNTGFTASVAKNELPSSQEAQTMRYRANDANDLPRKLSSMPTYQIHTVQRKSPPDFDEYNADDAKTQRYFASQQPPRALSNAGSSFDSHSVQTLSSSTPPKKSTDL